MNDEYISGTVGMIAYHEAIGSKMVRVEFHKTASGDVKLIATSGYSGGRFNKIPAVIISKDDFDNRDYDCYNSTVQFFWAIRKLGFEFSDNEEYGGE